ncbi:hypothetical protein PBRA_009694 [Plasmodiophora brassicae]|uniref:Uncharacterized protein n=1 Tax=Plasmodiophora brassicae TaxID=37360 RepID=A0A0G4ILB6_PLABS|nr:hypothetical protein PBRA_009694 [Plasmodiophora brassicae]
MSRSLKSYHIIYDLSSLFNHIPKAMYVVRCKWALMDDNIAVGTAADVEHAGAVKGCPMTEHRLARREICRKLYRQLRFHMNQRASHYPFQLAVELLNAIVR